MALAYSENQLLHKVLIALAREGQTAVFISKRTPTAQLVHPDSATAARLHNCANTVFVGVYDRSEFESMLREDVEFALKECTMTAKNAWGAKRDGPTVEPPAVRKGGSG